LSCFKRQADSSYTGFDRDLIGRARVRLVSVDLPQGDGAFTPDTLKAFGDKMDELAAEGIRTRAVIVCNPHNPLGRTYPRETLLEYMRFCEERDLHLVSDEIYAMSVYDNPCTLTRLLRG
jgi:aspartate/methionine/tyrosine aminotransferase